MFPLYSLKFPLFPLSFHEFLSTYSVVPENQLGPIFLQRTRALFLDPVSKHVSLELLTFLVSVKVYFLTYSFNSGLIFSKSFKY